MIRLADPFSATKIRRPPRRQRENYFDGKKPLRRKYCLRTVFASPNFARSRLASTVSAKRRTRGRTRSVDVCSATLDNVLNRLRITLRTIDRSLFNKRNRDYTHVPIRSAHNDVHERRLQSFAKIFKYATPVGVYLYIRNCEFSQYNLKILL